ncbi:UNVERIFIED_CONTAM: hypothetical protein FKN15_067091 [Acipenser sinensis]
MNTRCPPKRVPSAARFFTLCRLTVQPPQSYCVRGQRSSGQLTGKPAGARPDYRGRWCAGQTNDRECRWVTYGGSMCGRPYDPKEMELKALIERINRNTAAQVEQNKTWRLELGLPEWEPTELELLLQKWELESAKEAQQSPAPEELVLSQGREEEESFPKPEEAEPWLSLEPPAAIKREEVLSPEPEEVNSAPPPQLQPRKLVRRWSVQSLAP